MAATTIVEEEVNMEKEVEFIGKDNPTIQESEIVAKQLPESEQDLEQISRKEFPTLFLHDTTQRASAPDQWRRQEVEQEFSLEVSEKIQKGLDARLDDPELLDSKKELIKKMSPLAVVN